MGGGVYGCREFYCLHSFFNLLPQFIHHDYKFTSLSLTLTLSQVV